MMPRSDRNSPCHPERSEGSLAADPQMGKISQCPNHLIAVIHNAEQGSPPIRTNGDDIRTGQAVVEFRKPGRLAPLLIGHLGFQTCRHSVGVIPVMTRISNSGTTPLNPMSSRSKARASGAAAPVSLARDQNLSPLHDPAPYSPNPKHPFPFHPSRGRCLEGVEPC
jgi:hypothetical protein